MSTPYRVTLLQLKPDLSGTGAPSDRVDLGVKTPDEIFVLAGKLLEIKVPPGGKAEPAILVQRGDRGWRVVAHGGLIRMHESTSPLDDYWTVDTPRGLAQLPPFRGSGSSGPFANSRGSVAPTLVPPEAQCSAHIPGGGRPDWRGRHPPGGGTVVWRPAQTPAGYSGRCDPDQIGRGTKVNRCSSPWPGPMWTGKKPGDGVIINFPAGAGHAGRPRQQRPPDHAPAIERGSESRPPQPVRLSS